MSPSGGYVRKFLKAVGVTILVVLAIGAIGVGSLFYFGQRLDVESKAYVDSAVVAIAMNWEKAALLDRASPELQAAINPAQLDALFASFSRVGPMVQYQGSSGEANVTALLNVGVSVSATYLARATFQNGSGVFRVVVVKRNDRWQIYSFNFDAELTGARPA